MSGYYLSENQGGWNPLKKLFKCFRPQAPEEEIAIHLAQRAQEGVLDSASGNPVPTPSYVLEADMPQVLPSDSVDTLREKVAAILEASFFHEVIREKSTWIDLSQELAFMVKAGDEVSREDFVSLFEILNNESKSRELLSHVRRKILLEKYT